MTSPLYSVGQHVAVCTSALEVVIPGTAVLEVDWSPAEEVYIDPNTMRAESGGEPCWVYLVVGREEWFAERYLRPIQPGEYLTDSAPQKLEQPA